ncbi:MAG: hypothetical protein ACJASL_000129 [Paraglaciecola sp.]
MNKTNIGCLPHGSHIVTFSNTDKDNRIAELEIENRELEKCFDNCYEELGKVQHELNRALKEQVK